MRSKHVFLIKHGETEENRLGLHQGQALQGKLSERGVADISAVADIMASARTGVDRILTSPMSRCRESTALLAAALAPATVQVDQRLTAKNSGSLGGRPRELAVSEASRQGVPVHQLRTPGGESSEDVQVRYVGLWNEVRADEHPRTALVGHGGGIACLLLWLMGDRFDRYLDHVPGSACTTWFELHGGRARIRLMNVPPAELSSSLAPEPPHEQRGGTGARPTVSPSRGPRSVPARTPGPLP